MGSDINLFFPHAFLLPFSEILLTETRRTRTISVFLTASIPSEIRFENDEIKEERRRGLSVSINGKKGRQLMLGYQEKSLPEETRKIVLQEHLLIHFMATGTLDELPISNMTLYHSLNISTSIIFSIVLQLATDAIESIPFEYLFNNEITMKQLRALVLVWPNLRFKCESPDMTFGIAEKFSGGKFHSI